MIGQPAAIKITVRQHADVTVAAIEGDLDLHVSGDLREKLLRLIDEHSALVVDLARVTGIDSSGVASLLEVFQRANKRQRKFALASASELASARLEAIKQHRTYTTLVATFNSTSETSETSGANPPMTGYPGYTRTTSAVRTGPTTTADYVTVTVTVTETGTSTTVTKSLVIAKF